MSTHKGLGGTAKSGVALHRNEDLVSRRKNRFVEDFYRSEKIVDRIVAALFQLHSAAGNFYRTFGNVHSVERNFAARRRFVFTCDVKLVALGVLLGYGLGAVVKLVVAIFGCVAAVVDFLFEIRAEGFEHREENSSSLGVDGYSVDKVEDTVGGGFQLCVGVVEVEYAEKHLAVDVACVEVVDFGAGLIVVVFDMKAEVVFVDLVRAERINVFHHQLPIGQCGRKRRTAQKFQYQSLRRLHLRTKFTHFVGLAFVGVFVSHGKHLVVLKGRVERDKTELRVEGVFVGAKFSGVAYFFVIGAGLKTSVEGACDGVDVAHSLVRTCENIVKVVGGVLGQTVRHSRRVHRCLVVNLRRLAKVEESHGVSGVVGGKFFIRYPNLDVGNIYSRLNNGKVCQSPLVVVAEKMVEEEVAVCLVVACLNTEFVGNRSGVNLYGAGFAFLLREHCGGGKFAKFQVGLYTKKGAATLNQSSFERHRHVTELNALDYFVVVTDVFYVLLVLKFKSCLGVVVDSDFHLVADSTCNAYLHIHIKIKRHIVSLFFGKGKVVDFRNVHTADYLHISLSLDVDNVGTKHAVETTDVDIDTRIKVAVETVAVAVVAPCALHKHLLTPIFAHFGAVGCRVVALSVGGLRTSHIHSAYFLLRGVSAGLVVVLGLGGDIFGVFKLDRRIFSDTVGVAVDSGTRPQCAVINSGI